MRSTLSTIVGLLTTVVLPLSGCGTSIFAGSKAPVIEDKVGTWPRYQVGTLAVTTDRRIVLVRLQDDSKGGGRFCSEPPPDAGQNVTSAITALLDVSAEKIDATMKAELAKSLATNFQSFIKRSQGLQLYRDAMYNLCQNYLNNSIKQEDIKAMSEEILNKTLSLIDQELKLTNGNINPPPQQSAPVAPPLPARQPGGGS